MQMMGLQLRNKKENHKLAKEILKLLMRFHFIRREASIWSTMKKKNWELVISN